MPCIVRNMTDDEAILAMTDDNLRHREKILPMEKAQSLKMQVEAISHQGAKLEGVAAGDVGKRSTEIVGERNGMNYKQVQRYIRLTELVPELRKLDMNPLRWAKSARQNISLQKPPPGSASWRPRWRIWGRMAACGTALFLPLGSIWR